MYVALKKLDSVERVAAACRELFSIAHNSFVNSTSNRDTFNNFCFALAKKQIDYKRTGQVCFREWLIKAYQLVIKNKGNITTATSLLK